MFALLLWIVGCGLIIRRSGVRVASPVLIKSLANPFVSSEFGAFGVKAAEIPSLPFPRQTAQNRYPMGTIWAQPFFGVSSPPCRWQRTPGGVCSAPVYLELVAIDAESIRLEVVAELQDGKRRSLEEHLIELLAGEACASEAGHSLAVKAY